MKRKMLLLLAAITFAIVPLSVFAYTTPDHIGGGIIYGHSASFVNISIEPGQSVDVAIGIDMGIVKIEIKDERGAVAVQKSVNSTVCKQECIDISDLASGKYTISVKGQNTGTETVMNFVID